MENRQSSICRVQSGDAETLKPDSPPFRQCLGDAFVVSVLEAPTGSTAASSPQGTPQLWVDGWGKQASRAVTGSFAFFAFASNLNPADFRPSRAVGPLDDAR